MRLPPLLHRRHLLLASTAAIALAACGKRPPQAQALPAEASVLALGDSLTQGVGAKADEAWPSLLAERTGYCYAKSHLLAALLRANGIPAGLCYQRLTIADQRPPFCLHGLNAVYLPQYGWYRLDARGNKPGVAAEFCPPREQLAFDVTLPGEADLPGIFADPLASVVAVLARAHSYQEVAAQLPDCLPDDWPE